MYIYHGTKRGEIIENRYAQRIPGKNKNNDNIIVTFFGRLRLFAAIFRKRNYKNAAPYDKIQQI